MRDVWRVVGVSVPRGRSDAGDVRNEGVARTTIAHARIFGHTVVGPSQLLGVIPLSSFIFFLQLTRSPRSPLPPFFFHDPMHPPVYDVSILPNVSPPSHTISTTPPKPHCTSLTETLHATTPPLFP